MVVSMLFACKVMRTTTTQETKESLVPEMSDVSTSFQLDGHEGS
jgi:hypothetical protein